MSLEKMNDKMMREYLRDHRIDIGKPEYEEGSLFGKFTLFFRDETFNFRTVTVSPICMRTVLFPPLIAVQVLIMK